MGVIKKLVGAFFSFLGSIFKVFNIFKKSEYFLEADDAQTGGGKSKATTDKPAPVATATSTDLTASTPAAAQPKASAPAKPAAQAQETGAKPSAPAPSAPAPVAATAAPATAAPAKPAPTPQPAGPTVFAPDYLLSTNSMGGRRRPGPSMGRFMDMAKQVKMK